MVGNIEKEDLRGGGDECPLERATALRQAFLEPRASALRIVPRRRSETIAIERANARSRASRPPLCCGESAASRSSSGRDAVRTSASARDAATLAAMPGGGAAGGAARPA